MIVHLQLEDKFILTQKLRANEKFVCLFVMEKAAYKNLWRKDRRI